MAAASVVPVMAVQTLLDCLVIAQPFQSGGSLADDLLLAFETARRQLGDQRSSTDYTLAAIGKRVDNVKRFRNKCDMISEHRYVHSRQQNVHQS